MTDLVWISLKENLGFDTLIIYVMLRAIWHHLFNLKKLKNTDRRVLLLDLSLQLY